MMKAAVVFALIAFAVCATAQVCPLSGIPAAATASGLTTCGSLYNGKLACCNATTEQTFSPLASFLLVLGPTTSCYKNLVSIYCDSICDPSQATFAAVSVVNNTVSASVAVNLNTSNYAYDSCYKDCGSIGVPIGSIVNRTTTDPQRGVAFLGFVNSYLGNIGLSVKLQFNYNATGGVTAPMVSAGPNEATGCPTSAPTTKPSNATTGTSTTGTSTTGPSTPTPTPAPSSSASTLYATAFLIAVAFAL